MSVVVGLVFIRRSGPAAPRKCQRRRWILRYLVPDPGYPDYLTTISGNAARREMTRFAGSVNLR
jgi:hypothetical protein